jgi:RNA 3'-phosphate cyclase
MVTIDGSYHEGGGQILRTAIALSSITGQRVRIHHIRAGRKKPGLRPQHLKGIEGAAEITRAKTEGIFPGSQEVVFSPSRIRGGHYEIDIGTAGAVTLLLQELVPLALFADGSINLVLKGGTAVPYSPTIEYFRHIVCFFLKQMGVSVLVNAIHHGFYPRGGGEVSISIAPSLLTGIELTERGALQQIDAVAVASQKLQKAQVAERMVNGFKEVFPDADGKIAYSSIPSIGCFLSSHAHFAQSTIGADGLGKRGKRAEEVGRETAVLLKKELALESAIDRWMIDQIIIYLGLACHFSRYYSRIAVGALTPHAETAIWVVSHFLPVRFDIKDGILLTSLPISE